MVVWLIIVLRFQKRHQRVSQLLDFIVIHQLDLIIETGTSRVLLTLQHQEVFQLVLHAQDSVLLGHGHTGAHPVIELFVLWQWRFVLLVHHVPEAVVLLTVILFMIYSPVLSLLLWLRSHHEVHL